MSSSAESPERTRAQLAAIAVWPSTSSDLRAAGWTPSDLRAAGWTPSDLIAAGWTEYSDDWDAAPVLERPYGRLLEDIRERRRIHDQSTWGPDEDPKTNVCKTRMCTAWHLVNMAGEAGYRLKDKYGWAGAAAILAEKSHPGWPQQNYGSIPQSWALAFIEEMAAREEKS